MTSEQPFHDPFANARNLPLAICVREGERGEREGEGKRRREREGEREKERGERRRRRRREGERREREGERKEKGERKEERERKKERERRRARCCCLWMAQSGPSCFGKLE